jgi:hypothetical protein
VIAGIRRGASAGASGTGSLLTVRFRATREAFTQLFVTSAVPGKTGGGTMPVKGSGPLQIRVTGAAAAP